MIDYSKFPKSAPKKWSYLETLGVAHRETIIANLLGFYFDPQEKHGLGDTFIKCLLASNLYALKEKDSKGNYYDSQDAISRDVKFDSAKIIIEETTEENNRIDILIVTKQVLIAIEFKIEHTLDNPLNDYEKYIEEDYKFAHLHKHYIVLTPQWKRPKRDSENEKFKQVILSDFIDRVDERIRKNDLFYDRKGGAQQQNYQDFIDTVSNRKIKYNMIKDMVEYANAGEQEKELSSLYKDLIDVKKDIYKKVENLKDKLFDLEGQDWGIWTKPEILTVILFKDNDGVKEKIRLRLTGWTFEKEFVNGEKEIRKIGNYDDAIADVIEQLKKKGIMQNRSN